MKLEDYGLRYAILSYGGPLSYRRISALDLLKLFYPTNRTRILLTIWAHGIHIGYLTVHKSPNSIFAVMNPLRDYLGIRYMSYSSRAHILSIKNPDGMRHLYAIHKTLRENNRGDTGFRIKIKMNDPVKKYKQQVNKDLAFNRTKG